MPRKRNKKRAAAAPPKKPPSAPSGFPSSVQDEPSKQPKPTTEWLQIFNRVQTYWKTLSVENRGRFLEVNFQNLQAHYTSKNDMLAVTVISEALSYAKLKNTLKFWECCYCHSNFSDHESHKDHVQTHIGSLAAKLGEVLPKEADSSSVDMIRSGCWKPFDFNAAMKILENPATSPSLNINQRWPVVDDPKRAKRLESIQFMFQLLLKNKCLADNHVKKAIRKAMNRLRKLYPTLELLDHGLDKSLECICFLDAEKLTNIFLYLHDLRKLCQLGKDSEKTTSADDTCGVDASVSDILERIALSDDSTHLILKEFLLAAGTDSNKAGNAALDEDGGRSDWDNILYGLFRPSRTDVELSSWVCLREDRLRRGMEIFQKLKEFDLYQSLCEEKFKHQCYMEAFSDLEYLCLEVIRKREQEQSSDLETSRFDARIMQKLDAMQQLERELEVICGFDYREVMSLLAKKFVRVRLEYGKSDAAREALLMELDLEATSNVNKRGGDDSKQTQAKSKKKKKKNDYRRTKNPEGVGRDKETGTHQETKEQASTLVDATDVHQRVSVFVATESVDEQKELEEELEATKRKLAENEATQKRLADKSEGSSVGLHTGSVERTAVPSPSNQGISEDGLSLSGRQANSQNPTSDEHSQTLSEKENEANLSQIEGCFKEQTHPWVDPHLEDNETKALGHLSAEEHDDEERFLADLTKATQESLGATNQGISEDSLSPSGRQAHSQSPASDGHSQTFSENEHHEDNPSQIDEEIFKADPTTAVQESLEICGLRIP